jgi:predicted Fe-Mo cluster-binding NifX family protein
MRWPVDGAGQEHNQSNKENPMKIAVPSDDGLTVSGHFGRCRDFLVFEIEGNEVRQLAARPNGGCHDHGGSPEAGGQAGHGGFVKVLGDCAVVLCIGIGAGAQEALAAGGIQVVRVAPAGTAGQAVAAYHAGALQPASGGLCQCRH